MDFATTANSRHESCQYTTEWYRYGMQTVEEKRAKKAAAARAWRRKHPGDPRKGRRSEYTKKYRQTDAYKQAQLKYRRSRKGKATDSEYQKEQRKSVPEKPRARDAVKQAIRKGKIAKAEQCEKCLSKNRIQAHHENYSEPLKVTWLCPQCHTAIHHNERTHHIRSIRKTAASGQ